MSAAVPETPLRRAITAALEDSEPYPTQEQIENLHCRLLDDEFKCGGIHGAEIVNTFFKENGMRFVRKPPVPKRRWWHWFAP